MSEYYCVRVWEVRAGVTMTEVESLATSGVVEMQRWIPGVQRISLVRVQQAAREPQRYVMTLTFATQAAYAYWRQVEDEASDYWERFASVQLNWEQLCQLVAEYTGDIVMDMALEREMKG